MTKLNISSRIQQQDINTLQLKTIEKIDTLFSKYNISDLVIDDNYFFNDSSVKEDFLNLMLILKFKIERYEIELYLLFNQLEYYILKDNKIIDKCIVEDYVEEDEMLIQFINYLQKDLDKIFLLK